ncbi:hypothetical protein HMPREF0731_0504 [Pseudoroseomonas cervicalis ATCC 49957]|uniref:Uncharacterized protein n=1 Tax=Pseudoroseomonas cervicalis ATCC 49957 TaxID=525371 RepID=D5RHE5_9PROT|nr:hypothetical protein HMPREF0731_0504 [Pseudoroseomonas cervicalis ATCC 49957]
MRGLCPLKLPQQGTRSPAPAISLESKQMGFQRPQAFGGE